MIINEKIQEKINQSFELFQQGKGAMFPLSETAFHGINIYFDQIPKHLLFELQKIGDTEVYIGAESEDFDDDTD
jgi:hypothetical protein